MNPALVIIDVQKGIDEIRHWGGNRNNPEAEGNIKLLLELWRSRKFPVYIVQHCSTDKESPLHPDQPGNELKDFIFALRDERLIKKSRANAFIGTSLREDMLVENVSSVVITGFVTNNSVESTARMCGEIGFKTIVISDATAAFNRTGLDGSVYPSELIHQISLSNLSKEYAEITTTHELISKIDNEH
jgi:nicotinamidase-related amidase